MGASRRCAPPKTAKKAVQQANLRGRRSHPRRHFHRGSGAPGRAVVTGSGDVGQRRHRDRAPRSARCLPAVRRPRDCIPRSAGCTYTSIPRSRLRRARLRLHDLIDDIPTAVHIAVPRGTRRPAISYPPIVVAQYAAKTFDLNIEQYEATRAADDRSPCKHADLAARQGTSLTSLRTSISGRGWRSMRTDAYEPTHESLASKSFHPPSTNRDQSQSELSGSRVRF